MPSLWLWLSAWRLPRRALSVAAPLGWAPGRAPPLLARLGAAGAYVAERRVRDAYAHLAAALAAAADDGEGLLGERLAAVVDVCYEVRAAAAL